MDNIGQVYFFLGGVTAGGYNPTEWAYSAATNHILSADYSDNGTFRIPLLDRLEHRGVPRSASHNPVVPNWDDAAYEAEKLAKAQARYFICHLGNPHEQGRQIISAGSISDLVHAMCFLSVNVAAYVDLDGLAHLPRVQMRPLTRILDLIKTIRPGALLETKADFHRAVFAMLAAHRDATVPLFGTCGNNLWRKELIAAGQRGQMGDNLRRLIDVNTPDFGRGVQYLEGQLRQQPFQAHFIGDPQEPARDKLQQLPLYSLAETTLLTFEDYRKVVLSVDMDTWSRGSHERLVIEDYVRRLAELFPKLLVFTSLQSLEDWMVRTYQAIQK